MKLSSILIAAVLSISGGTFAIPVPLYSRALQQPSLLGHDVEVYRRVNERDPFPYLGPIPRPINTTAPAKSSLKKNDNKIENPDHQKKKNSVHFAPMENGILINSEEDSPAAVGYGLISVPSEPTVEPPKPTVEPPTSKKRQAGRNSQPSGPSKRSKT